jgi:hypothetical protein
MMPLLLLLLASAHADDEAPPRRGFLSGLRYAVGGVVHVGAGSTGTPFEGRFVFEPAAFELRSYFSRHVAWHTTLNVGRMVVPAVTGAPGRLDYDLHVAVHLPWDDHHEIVVGPGANIGYAFAGGYQRFAGSVRLGVDRHGPGRWTTVGVYLQPWVGWSRADDTVPGAIDAGVHLELAVLAHLPKKGERGGAPRPTGAR